MNMSKENCWTIVIKCLVLSTIYFGQALYVTPVEPMNKSCTMFVNGEIMWDGDSPKQNVQGDVILITIVCQEDIRCLALQNSHLEQNVLEQTIQHVVVQSGIKFSISISTLENTTERHFQLFKSFPKYLQPPSNSISEWILLLDSDTSETLYFTVPQEYTLQGHNILICTLSNETTPDDFSPSCFLNITVKDVCESDANGLYCSEIGLCTSSLHQPFFTCKCCNVDGGSHCKPQLNNNETSDMCSLQTCKNGGTCIQESVHIVINISGEIKPNTQCICPSNFTGHSCENPLKRCDSNPCVHGVCQEHTSGYTCYCVSGFYGSQCQLEYNECLSNPCHNGGTCIDMIDKYNCSCTQDYLGDSCSIKVNICDPNPCLKNGTCTFVGQGYHCSCMPGYNGPRCEKAFDICWSSPCQNRGMCVVQQYGYKCLCPITFAGIHCEYMLDVFGPPMEHNIGGISHKHNMYVVAGTLCSMIVIVLLILIACYCKIYETYKSLTWKHMKYRERSNSCPDLESFAETFASPRPRLSVDTIWESRHIGRNNPAYDSGGSTISFSSI